MTVSQSSSSSRNFQITPSDQYYNNKKRLSKVYISRLTFVIGVGLILLLLFHQLISSSFSSSRPKTSAKHLLLQHDRRSNRHSSTALSSTSSSQKIFNEKYPLDVVNQLDNSRYVRLNGWHFCQCLEGSAFDAFTKIYPLGGSIATLNPTNKQVIQVIEKEAKTIFRKLDVILEDKGADHLDLWRFSCHFAADGVNGL